MMKNEYKKKLSYVKDKEQMTKQNQARFQSITDMVKMINKSKLFEKWNKSILPVDLEVNADQPTEPLVMANGKQNEQVPLDNIRTCITKPSQTLKIPDRKWIFAYEDSNYDIATQFVNDL